MITTTDWLTHKPAALADYQAVYAVVPAVISEFNDPLVIVASFDYSVGSSFYIASTPVSAETYLFVVRTTTWTRRLNTPASIGNTVKNQYPLYANELVTSGSFSVDFYSLPGTPFISPPNIATVEQNLLLSMRVSLAGADLRNGDPIYLTGIQTV